MMKRLALAIGFVLASTTAVNAGTIKGQGRDLSGAAVNDISVIVQRGDGRIVTRNRFLNGRYNITIPDNLLFAADQAVTVTFSSPGREDVRLDNVLGTAQITNLDVVLRVSASAGSYGGSSGYGCCQPCYPRRHRHFRRCR